MKQDYSTCVCVDNWVDNGVHESTVDRVHVHIHIHVGARKLRKGFIR